MSGIQNNARTAHQGNVSPEDQAQVLTNRLRDASVEMEERFVQLTQGGKAPSQGDSSWTKFSEDPPPLVESGYNYGVIGGSGLLILDIDSYDQSGKPTLLAELRRRGLEETVRVSSPHGGTHLYYSVPIGTPEEVKNELGSKNPKGDFGETRLSEQYVLGPGSHLFKCEKNWHDCSNTDEGHYELANAGDLIELDSETVVDILTKDPKIAKGTQSGAGDTPSTTSVNRSKQSNQESKVEIPNDVEEATENNIRELDQKVSRANDDKARALIKWAKGEVSAESQPILREYRDDRSAMETALAQKVWFYTGSKDQTISVIEALSPPKWSERGESYRRSVLSSASQYVPEDSGFTKPQLTASHESGVIYEKASDIVEVIVFRIGSGGFTATDVAVELKQRYKQSEAWNQSDVVGEQQIRKVLRLLAEVGYLTKKNRGGNVGIRWKVQESIFSDIVTIDRFLEEEYLTLKEVNEQRQEYVYTD